MTAAKGYPLVMSKEYRVKNLNPLEFEKNTKDNFQEICKDTITPWNAEYCGAWIKLNGWKIPDDYPYL